MPPVTVLMEEELLDKHLEKALSDKPIAHFPLKAVDEMVGGVRPGRVVIIAGKPGSSKTSLFLQLADSVACQGVPTIFFTFELEPSALLLKSLARIIGDASVEDVPKLSKSKEGSEILESALTKYRKNIAPYLAFVDGRCNLTEMAEYVEAVRDRFDGAPCAVFVDYIQICESDKNLDERLEIKSAMTSLRSVANICKASVFAISTINRTNYDKAHPGLGALGGCSYVEYNADAVLHLSEDKSCKEDLGYEGRPVRALVIEALKNRYGPVGVRGLAFDAKASSFTDRRLI